MMAGRCISVTHVALGTVRVMRTCGMMGEVVGMAASVCKERNVDPRGVYSDHLDELKALMQRGVGKAVPEAPRAARPSGERVFDKWLAEPGESLARKAKITVSGSLDERRYPARMLVDGRGDTTDNGGRWLSNSVLPHRIEFDWDEAQTVGAARIVTGWGERSVVSSPITDFKLQYVPAGGGDDDWRDVPGASAAGNASPRWAAEFPAVTARRMRLVVTATHTNISRIWEVGLYAPSQVRVGGK